VNASVGRERKRPKYHLFQKGGKKGGKLFTFSYEVKGALRTGKKK